MTIGVLISGSGTNLQALIDAPAIEIAAVVSSRTDAHGLIRAEQAGIPHIATGDPHETRAFLDRHGVDLVVLAGYMRILPAWFVAGYPDRVLNVHPSLLPAFPGRTPVEDALAHGVRVTGVTVHLVDAEGIDTGPIVLQEAVAVSYDDDASGLLERLHEVEWRLLPEAVRLVAGGRIEIDGRRVRVKDPA